jgi:hypothetical protein
MALEAELTEEIRKWSSKLDSALSSVKPAGEQGEGMFKNIKAYREDSKHFLERGDLIKSFECLIWAWALLEMGRQLGYLRG